MSERMKELNRQIVKALAAAIKVGDPIEEIKDMIVDSPSYRSAMQCWRDPCTDLDVLQLSVVSQHLTALKYLCQQKEKLLFHSCRMSEKVNPPLHLACKVGNVDIIQYLVEEMEMDLTVGGYVTYPHPATHKPFSDMSARTPYQISVEEGHVNSACYLCKYIVYGIDRPIHPIKESTLLHQACYLGCAEHVQLLLDNGYLKHINDKDRMGHMPLHIASLTAEAQCMQVLLQNGASVKSRADHRTCLHIMYWSKFRPENLVQSTQTLIEYGINVDAMDHNNNTALDYLAWELGQKWYQISKAWVSSHRVAEIYNYMYTKANYNKPVLSDDKFRAEIFKCIEMLLQAGASTLIRSLSRGVDHTIVHTLLQNTGWPLNSSLQKRPLEVYRALTLFFQHGADPNVIARNNNESALTMLLMHSLHEIPAQLKMQFVALFLMNGANLECLIREPKQYKENYSDRRWNIYPVMVALQERHPIDIVKMLYDFMSFRHVYNSLRMTEDKFLWHRMTWTLGGGERDFKYREQWLTIRTPKVRSLKHMVKLVILKALDRYACLVEELPLPSRLKMYLMSTDC